MAILLNIDSAFEECNVALSNNEELIAHEKSAVQKDHASFLQPAIKRACNAASVALTAIDAVAVINGPGSYTGLRVGLASAKGICYALQKPLILINTLNLVAFALQQTYNPGINTLICPMIDARRMEVFTALYDNRAVCISNYTSVILDSSFLAAERKYYDIIYGGNGSFKLKNFSQFETVICNPHNYSIVNFISLAFATYKLKYFADVAYSEPLYIKPVYFK